jgi:transcriptional regulator with XRE-family HTH domain
MAPTSSPTVWRRWLALELRRLRREANLGQKEAGNLCGWSGARLSYIEAAKQDAREDDLDKLLPLYNVPEDNWADYYTAAERSRERGWWERYQREMPDYLSLFLGLEQGASVVQTYEPAVVPGLLQTREYAAAVLRHNVWPRTDQEITRLIDLRLKRQEILTRRDQPLQFSAVLDEAALRHVANDAPTMALQLEHLADMAELPNVTIRVIPFERGAQSYAQTNFTIFDFPWESDAMVVYVELRDQALYLEEQQDIKGFVLAFHNLWQLAPEEDKSLATMRAIAKEYTKP